VVSRFPVLKRLLDDDLASSREKDRPYTFLSLSFRKQWATPKIFFMKLSDDKIEEIAAIDMVED